MEKIRTITPEGVDASKRLDVFLSEKLAGITRSGVKHLMEKGLVLVNGREVKAGYRLRTGDTVTVGLPESPAPLPLSEPIPLDILYEDEDVIVVNKQAGLPVHPGAGRASGTLVNALLGHTRNLSSIGSPDRPGIVHRLDMDTTGSLVIARNDPSHISLSRQFREHSAVRKYLALVWGQMRADEGTIDLPIGRDVKERKKISTRSRKKREAVTGYRVIRRYPQFTLLELTPETGRTHQLRVHLSSVNHPIVGDQQYGRKAPSSGLNKPVLDMIKGIKRQLLHARVLGFNHPRTGEYMEFSAPVPGDMEEALTTLDRLCS